MKHPKYRLLLVAGFALSYVAAAHAQQTPRLEVPSAAATSKILVSPPLHEPAVTALPYRNANFTTRLLAGAHHTYGYEVQHNGRVLISQPGIPGRAGNQGFRTAAAAQRVAALVVAKLRDNQMPPTVTAAELRQLHAEQ